MLLNITVSVAMKNLAQNVGCDHFRAAPKHDVRRQDVFEYGIPTKICCNHTRTLFEIS